MRPIRQVIAAIALALIASNAIAGRIVVNHDEWTLSNTGFSQSPDAAVFVDNVSDFFTGGGTGSFYGASTNFGLVQSSLANAFAAAGHTYATGSAATNLAALLSFDGILVAGPLTGGLTTSVLVDYVNAGGNVYLAGGTGVFGTAAAEAAFWNVFLNSFGLSFQSNFNGISGDLNVQPSPHPIFDNVSTLYANNGNTAFGLVANDPNARVFFDGQYAVYDMSGFSVPEPGTLALLGIGLLGMGLARRRKKI